jgi:sialate O-acetylesterase
VVQLANLHEPPDTPVENEWAEMRESQFYPYTVLEDIGVVTAHDVGEADDIHPRDKKSVGERLALWALAQVYEQDIPWSGPQYESDTRQGEKVIVTFSHVYDGLRARDGKPVRGFEIAGSDMEFVSAEAEITSDSTVAVWSRKVRDPQYIRHNWSQNPAGNLYNSADLPAFAFRTDDKPAITMGRY